MKFFAHVGGRKVHCYVAAERRGGWAIQILLCGSLIPILLSFLMTINEDIYSAQFGCRPQNVQVCPSATFIGVDISRLHRPAFPCHNIFQHTNSSKAKIGQIPKPPKIQMGHFIEVTNGCLNQYW